MGLPGSERDGEAQERQHPVTIVTPFDLGIYEVTQAEWTGIMGANPSRVAGCPRCPVERVSYYDIERFLAKLNQLSSWPGIPRRPRLTQAGRGKLAAGSSQRLTRP